MRRKCTKPPKNTAKPETEPACPCCGKHKAFSSLRDYTDRVLQWKCRHCGTVYASAYGQEVNRQAC